MKHLSLIALFVLSWQTWEMKKVPTSTFNGWSQEQNTVCTCDEVNHTKFFDDEMEMLSEKTALELDKHNINVKVFDAKERKGLEVGDKDKVIPNSYPGMRILK